MTGEGTGITFGAFLLSLARTAAVQFGDLPDPMTGARSAPNLSAAAEMIDLIGLLQQKTRGNLTPEESELLEQVLHELRLRFVQARQGERRIVEP
jgi:hypothetical protein